VPRHEVVVVAASAGGIEALREVLGGLDPEFPAAIFVVLHVGEGAGSALTDILRRASTIPVTTAVEGEPIEPGRVYVCVAGHHLLVGDGVVLVRRGPTENGHRPAADPLFRSAARYFGPAAVGVVLSGTLSDGSAGLRSIRDRGGVAVVQDPVDAMFPGMPQNALKVAGADHVVDAAAMGPLLSRVVREAATEPPEDEDPRLGREVEMMEHDGRTTDAEHLGTPSPWPCPDCSGVLWEIDDGHALHFRCRVGHAWSAHDLFLVQGDEVERALWMALRSMEDRAALQQRLASRAAEGGRPLSAHRFEDLAEEMAHSISVLRRILGSDMLQADHQDTADA